MRKITLFLAFVGLVVVVAIGFLSEKDIELTTLMKLQEKYPKKEVRSADHSKFPNLQKKFNSPKDILDFIEEKDWLIDMFPVDGKTGSLVTVEEFIADLNAFVDS